MRLRLFLSFLLIVLITSVGILLLTSWRVREDIGQFLYRGGLSGSEQLVENLEAHYRQMHGWNSVEASIVQAGAGQLGMQMATLADAEGNILVAPGHMGGMGPGMMGQSRGQNQGQSVTADRLTEEQIQAAIPLFDGENLVGYLLPENPLRVPAGIENSLLDRLTRSAMIASGIAALLSLVLAVVLATVLLRPVRELTQAAAAMGRGDLSQRVRPGGGRETRLLAQTFNDMAGSLEQAEARRRALTADIAHELRNPLAIQRANIEALQDGLLPMNTEQLEPVARQNLHLTSLVDDLRTLALADAGHLSLEKTPTDLAGLIRRRSHDLEAEAALREVTLKTDLPAEPCEVRADPARIGQILANLLSNALRHSPGDSEILISLAPLKETVLVSVRDHGAGIAEEDLPHIFERFYRGDRARQRTGSPLVPEEPTTGVSTGLGLSIARRLAEAHGGTLQAGNHPDGGAVFTLTLPR